MENSKKYSNLILVSAVVVSLIILLTNKSQKIEQIKTNEEIIPKKTENFLKDTDDKTSTPKKINSTSHCLFNRKLVVDSDYDDSVYITGTLKGDGVGYKENTLTINCIKDDNKCSVVRIENISSNSCQLSRLEAPQYMSIISWDNNRIIATNEDSFYGKYECYRVTISIDRKTQNIQWIQQPVNQESTYCKKFKIDNNKYIWTIEDPSN